MTITTYYYLLLFNSWITQDKQLSSTIFFSITFLPCLGPKAIEWTMYLKLWNSVLSKSLFSLFLWYICHRTKSMTSTVAFFILALTWGPLWRIAMPSHAHGMDDYFLSRSIASSMVRILSPRTMYGLQSPLNRKWICKYKL